jgi:hypothetical protein
MLENKIHCFWHEGDERTLTSKGYIWTYPYKEVTEKSIICLQHELDVAPQGCLGICSDWPNDQNDVHNIEGYPV